MSYWCLLFMCLNNSPFLEYFLLQISQTNSFSGAPPCCLEHLGTCLTRPDFWVKVALQWGQGQNLPWCSFWCWFRWPLVLYECGHWLHWNLKAGWCVAMWTLRPYLSPAVKSHWLHCSVGSFRCWPLMWVFRIWVLLHIFLQMVQVLFPSLTLLSTAEALCNLYSLQASTFSAVRRLTKLWCCCSRSLFSSWCALPQGASVLGLVVAGLLVLKGGVRTRIGTWGHTLGHTQPSPSSSPPSEKIAGSSEANL